MKVDGVEVIVLDYTIISDLDGSSISSVFGALLLEDIEVELLGDVSGEILDIDGYGEYQIYEANYDDKKGVTKLKAQTDIDFLDVKFEMPDVNNTNDLLSALDLPTPSVNIPLKSTLDKYYSTKLKLMQDIGAMTRTIIKFNPLRFSDVDLSIMRNYLSDGDKLTNYNVGQSDSVEIVHHELTWQRYSGVKWSDFE